MSAAPLPHGASVAVIGAGIIGTSAAFVLAERGYTVTIIDRDEPGMTGPSFGNAGHLAGEGIIPLSTPGIAGRALKMLADPTAPLKIRAAHAPQLVPWLWRFWRTSGGGAYRDAIRRMTELNAGALEATEALFAKAGMSEKMRREPALFLYESEGSFEADRPHWDERTRAGLVSVAIDAAEVRRVEPGLAPIFVRGVLCQTYGMVTDPIEVVRGYFAAATARGAAYERARVTALRGAGDGVAVRTEAGERTFDAALVTTGVWSKALAATIGDYLPVEAERGYNLTYPGLRPISRPLLLADRGIAVTPLAPGLRFGGWTELGGTTLPPEPRRWGAIRRVADETIPGLKDVPAREWMGHRPSMPDSVPVISPSGKSPRLFYAVGHGHYGLSFSARTAGIVGEMIGDGRKFPSFSIGRFR